MGEHFFLLLLQNYDECINGGYRETFNSKHKIAKDWKMED